METSSSKIWYVCHGPDVVHFVEADVNSVVKSGQPNIEQFDTEEEALARAIELGYEPDESELDT